MKTFTKLFSIFLILGLLFTAMPKGEAEAASEIVYDAILNPLPGNVVSMGFQATSTSEFGDYVHLAGTNRLLRTVTVTMSTWALESTYYPALDGPEFWQHPITVNFYEATPGTPNVLGALIATKTQTFDIPWRPEADPTCATPTAWRALNGTCYNGYAFNITFDLSSLNAVLPDDVVVSLAYNTNTWGYTPIGAAGPYESLNVGAGGSATVGIDKNVDNVFLYSMWSGAYEGVDKSTGAFREDTNWTPYGTLPIQITADPAPATVYVDDSWSAVAPGDDPDAGGPATQMGYDAFISIQEGIDAVADGGTVNVAAGTYAEDYVYAWKAVNLIGPNAGIPADGTRAAEAIVYGDTGEWFTVYTDVANTTIDGFTFDGQYLDPGAYYSVGIFGYAGNLTIQNNIFTGHDDMAIMTSGGYPGLTTYLSGVTIKDNLITNVDPSISPYNFGIYLQSTLATVTGNIVENMRTGIQVQPYQAPGAGLVDGNTFEAYRLPVWYNYAESAATNWTFSNNVMNGIARPISEADKPWTGIRVETFYGGNVAFTGNTINIGTANATELYMFRKVNATGGIVDLEDTLNNNTWERVAVRTDGTNITIPDFYSGIQKAIDASAGNETIWVGPGTYREAVTLNKANITVESTDGRDTTIIDVPFGTLTTGVKVLANMGAVTFDGFTVKNFTEGGIIQGMSAGTGTVFHVLNNKVLPYGTYLRNGIQVSGDGSTVIGNYVEGAFLTTDWASTAIGVVDANNVLVQGNEVSGAVNGIDYGIAVYNWSDALVQNVQVLNNTIYNADYPLGAIAYNDGTVRNVDFNLNRVTNYEMAIDAAAYSELGYETYWGTLVEDIDATHNWWGSMFGPQAPFSGEPTLIKWCGDATCTWFLPDDNNVIEVDEDISQTGGIQINVPYITILLKDGTVIQNASPCFIVNASYTTITTESIGGAQCVPTSGSNGIDVAADLVNITIEGIEFVGTAGTDGIHFAGGITDLVIVDNWFHNLLGDGIEFTAQPAGVINIQGNLFQNNLGKGIEAADHTIDAEYNSWGNVAGAAAGDGASAGVTTDPYTHVDLYMVSEGTPTLNEVPTGGTITYTVYANVENALSVDFSLFYPTNLTLLGDPVDEGTFSSYAAFDTTVDNRINFSGMSSDYVTGAGFTPVSGTALPVFSVTFTGVTPGTGFMNLDELTDGFGMEGYESSSNIYAAALADSPITVLGNFSVTGTVSMQGRSARLGVPAMLTGAYTYNATSTAAISNNLVFPSVNSGTYTFTTNQGRYLNLYTALAKAFTLTNANYTLTTLELKGGNAVWMSGASQYVIDVDDASLVGTMYGDTDGLVATGDHGDVNFSGKVDIFDLALVGGNFDLTSAVAYATWAP